MGRTQVTRINIFFASTDTFVRMLLADHGITICTIIARKFGIKPEHVKLIPHILSVDEMKLSKNLSRLELAIDLHGTLHPLNDDIAKEVVQEIIQACEETRRINFEICISTPQRCGSAKHQPTNL